MLQFVLWLPDGSLCHPGVPKQPAGASSVVGTLGAAVDMNDSCLRTSWSAFFLLRAGLFRLQSLTGCTQMLQSEHHPSLTKLLGTPSSNGLQQCVLLQRGITGWTQFLQTVNPVSTRLWVKLLWPQECLLGAGRGHGLSHATAMGRQSCGCC